MVSRGCSRTTSATAGWMPTMAEIEEAARAVRAHEFISDLPGGYEAPVNEAGTNLSVGQKQLLSFARILLMDPRILILDEATASIDTKTERLLQEAIRRILVGRTSFVIAHRLSTIENADVIFVLEDGRIVEQGTHAGSWSSDFQDPSAACLDRM